MSAQTSSSIRMSVAAYFGKEALHIDGNGCCNVVSELSGIEIGLQMFISIAFDVTST